MSNAMQALQELVTRLDTTSWSCWQTTSSFSPALDAARREVAAERIRDAAHDLLGALIDIHERLMAARELNLSAQEAYDSFYQDSVTEAIAKATGAQS